MPRKRDDDDDKRNAGDRENRAQPPPPDMGGGSGGGGDNGHGHGHDDDDNGRHHGHGKHHHHEHDALYDQLVEVKRVLAQLLQETRDERVRRKLEYVPVRTSDLMRGFQSAVAKANRATQAGDLEGEDIERMSIKDLKVTLSAPIIDGGHADDPVVMLPNIKSVDADSAQISLEFGVVSVPLKGRG